MRASFCGVYCTSKEVLPAGYTSKVQISSTSVQSNQLKTGYSNQEIYEGIIRIKKNITSLFHGEYAHSDNYSA